MFLLGVFHSVSRSHPSFGFSLRSYVECVRKSLILMYIYLISTAFIFEFSVTFWTHSHTCGAHTNIVKIYLFPCLWTLSYDSSLFKVIKKKWRPTAQSPEHSNSECSPNWPSNERTSNDGMANCTSGSSATHTTATICKLSTMCMQLE